MREPRRLDLQSMHEIFMDAYYFPFSTDFHNSGTFRSRTLDQLRQIFGSSVDEIYIGESRVDFVFNEDSPIKNIIKFREILNALE